MVTRSWPDVVEVVQFSFGPCSLAIWGALLSARYRCKKPFQLTRKQFAPSWVLVRVGWTELWVPALSTLGEDFGDGRFAVSIMNAVDCGLLPALLGF